ncbi:FecR family protein [Chitinophaga polysaccharea]|uniref:FecR family protein n=1 Tax=Chitinophaga polysaccharea TaxID=1293035 RepID=A0A561PT90_9BACT|nr:FecR domain-containing protein [Chitinophaga polysaccharea]TWF41306.1 FecR family protein [Chitinophaga polysaccharea]
MEVSKIRQLFKKYMLGHTSGEEQQVVEQWYQLFDADVLPNMDEAEQARVKQEIWRGIQPQIVVAKTFYLKRPWVRAAAAILLLAGAGATWLMLHSRSTAPRYATYTTRVGERITIHLGDGSLLALNAGTTIRVPEDLSKTRTLQLIDGEAFFDVKTNPDLPFIVESGPVRTTVLGTSFNVAAYKDMQTLTVGVVSGKVRIATNHEQLQVLERDQELIYNKTNRQMRVASVDESLPGWKEGRLVFNDVSFDDMVILMEKNFGISISTTADHVKSTRYTTELPTGMDPGKAAQVLAAIHHLKVRVVSPHTVIYE